MKKSKKVILIVICSVLVLVLLTVTGFTIHLQNADWGYARQVSAEEQTLRQQLVETVEKWLGCKESDGSHKQIIDLYNRHKPLAVNYKVSYTDEWCATFVSAAAIQCSMTDIIPTECGCQRQIELFMELNRWLEADDYIPLPGDIIYYCWNGRNLTGDCTCSADHVGIVVGTTEYFIKVIEGNYADSVCYRYIPINAPDIRGFATPDYPHKPDLPADQRAVADCRKRPAKAELFRYTEAAVH